MRLTIEEQGMLAGDLGPGVQKAMEIITALGKIYGAEDLVPVASVQVAGVSYKNLGDAGLAFLDEWAAQGGKVRVPTTLNPAGVDLEQWQSLGFDAEFARKQNEVIAAFMRMGIAPTCTCTPYLVGTVPHFGEHIAWAESSAISFANSVLGARTNREGGPSALAAAIAGRTARYGLHLEKKRRAQLLVEVTCPVRSAADFGALGYLVGRVARNRIPFFRGLDLPPFDAQSLEADREGMVVDQARTLDSLKLLGAAMAASGAVALYHVEGVTPESHLPAIVMSGAENLTIDDLTPGYQSLTTDDADDRIDLVWIGCPHASLSELGRVIDLLRERRVQAALWVTISRVLRQEAVRRGLVAELEACGARVVADTCLVVAPVRELGFQRMATPSGKGAYYCPAHSGLQVKYGSLEACVEAAVSGCWLQQ